MPHSCLHTLLLLVVDRGAGSKERHCCSNPSVCQSDSAPWIVRGDAAGRSRDSNFGMVVRVQSASAGTARPAGHLGDWLLSSCVLPPPSAQRRRRDLGLGGELRHSRARCRSYTSYFIHTIMPPKKPAGNVVQAEVALKQSLKNCLVNLPSTLVSVLVNANAVSDAAGAMRPNTNILYRSRRMSSSSSRTASLLHLAHRIPGMLPPKSPSS